MFSLLKTEAATRHIALKLANCCPKNKRFVVFLSGELGIGKTYFVRAFLKHLGYTEAVKSPTYTLIESYDIASTVIFHLDLYRLQTPYEIFDIGLHDDFNRPAIWLIEWPERALAFLPKPDIVCDFSMTGSARQLQCKFKTNQGHQVLICMQK